MIEKEVEYKVIFTRPGLKYWGEFMHRFKTYLDAEAGMKDFMKEYGFGIYRIIKESRKYEVVKEEISE